jgi:hypothetical protein
MSFLVMLYTQSFVAAVVLYWVMVFRNCISCICGLQSVIPAWQVCSYPSLSILGVLFYHRPLMRQADKFTDFAGLAATVVVNWPDFNVRPILHANKVTLIDESFCL